MLYNTHFTLQKMSFKHAVYFKSSFEWFFNFNIIKRLAKWKSVFNFIVKFIKVKAIVFFLKHTKHFTRNGWKFHQTDAVLDLFFSGIICFLLIFFQLIYTSKSGYLTVVKQVNKETTHFCFWHVKHGLNTFS